MLLIKDTMVSLDLIERFFVCDLDSCLGQCCIDGDAGAPLLEEEREEIERHMDEILPLLNPSAQSIIKECGASYIDEEGILSLRLWRGRTVCSPRMPREGSAFVPLRKHTERGNFRN